MAELFDITHDANNLNEYDATVTDGGDLSTGTPGLASTTAKMEALIDDTTAIYAGKNQTAPASNGIRYRYYIDPNGLTMGADDKFIMHALRTSFGAGFLVVVELLESGGDYHLKHHYYTDAGWGGQDTELITDAEHYVEIYIERASGSGGNDGQVRWWVDGVLKATWSSLDNWDVFAGMTLFRFGAVDELDAGTSGTLHIDEIEANDDGGEIGPVSAVALPMAMDLYRFRRV